MVEHNWIDQGGFLSNDEFNKFFFTVAQPLMKFQQFVTSKDDKAKKKGETMNWTKVANVTDVGGKVIETDSMPETNQVLTLGTLIVTEYVGCYAQ